MRHRPSSSSDSILRALPLPLLLAALAGGAGGAAAAVPANAGGLTVTAAAAVEGDHGLRVTIDGRLGAKQRAYLVDDEPAAEATYRAAFWLDARRLQMAADDSFVLFEAVVRNPGPGPRLRPAFRLVLRKGWRLAAPRLLGEVFAADGTRRETATVAVPARRGPHRVQVEWRAAEGGADGLLRVALLGERPVSVEAPAVANAGHRLVSVRLGAVNGIDAGTRGSFDLDGFASFRTFADPPPP